MSGSGHGGVGFRVSGQFRLWAFLGSFGVWGSGLGPEALEAHLCASLAPRPDKRRILGYSEPSLWSLS